MREDFEQCFGWGRTGESVVANWLRYQRGCWVLPVYEKAFDDHKGPRLFTESGEELIAPDMFVWNGMRKPAFIEAKRKGAFSWYRIGCRKYEKPWMTGIDLKHYEHYCLIDERSPFPVWLLFLHEAGCAKDTPSGEVSPTGLYGGPISRLKKCEDHRSMRHGKHGMVYWHISNLVLFASLEELRSCSTSCDNSCEPWADPTFGGSANGR